MIRNFIDETRILGKSLIDSMEQNYESLFKGAVILLGVSLAGFMQSYPEITKFDYDARKIQYEVEALAGKKIDDIDCGSIEKKQAECNLAKYQLSSNKSAMRLASFIIVVCGYLGLFLMYLSVHGFVSRALRQHRDST